MIFTRTPLRQTAVARYQVFSTSSPSTRFAAALTLIALLGRGSPTLATEPEPRETRTNPVFAFCFDTHDTENRNLAQQAAMLRELGFDGAGHIGTEDAAERLKTLEDRQLRLFLIGTRIDLADDQSPYPPTLAATLTQVKGRGVTLYVTITGCPPSSPEGDKKVVPILRRLARLADASGVRVALYPHTGDWLVRVDHAIDLVRQVDDQNLGLVFNLCHWMKNEDLAQLAPLLDQALPHLFAVTINGADPAGIADPDWRRLIQPLDRGSFDVKGVVRLLSGKHYEGPVGIMCYGIQEDSRRHLSRSIETWRKWTEDGN